MKQKNGHFWRVVGTVLGLVSASGTLLWLYSFHLGVIEKISSMRVEIQRLDDAIMRVDERFNTYAEQCRCLDTHLEIERLRAQLLNSQRGLEEPR